MFKKIIAFILISTLFTDITASAATYPGNVSARGAILMEQESGRVLYEKEAHTQMRIASITKIMTAILAIESGELDEWVTVSSNAEGTEGSSIYLVAEEEIQLRDLVYGLMLRSGNDSAVAIAEHVGGSLEGFVYMMNEKAQELGMTRTVFSNPHGLDDHEEHYSTAYDMALLTRYAMDNEEYKEIAGTKSYRSKNKDDHYRVFNNKNRLLTQLYRNSTGGKTGYTKRAKRTLVSTAEKEDVELIAVTINAPDDWNDHISMFEWAFSTFNLTTIVSDGLLTNINDEYYRNKVNAEYSFEYPVAENEEIEKKITLLTPEEKWAEKGHPYPIGKLEIMMNNDVIGVVPLSYIEEIVKEEKSFFKKWFDQLFAALGVKASG
ncbi:D-alanyl-D-alanine carboxypeptidase family protein [Evansella cellulosilytica]|uniref:Peptidase S11 D-alanyl-D-alanine carboxypeptidase 1 n=1 Tax=Evansella cellulosilytica (strain ATCC 21833 / DSM 2522 / FERM P-1141 / JCM 9156 / N-4) TaxID=649639 RepID=E6TYM9_EVAC2|nr:D-alanyl-D-alanine carboxypeptidase family protein [Evansella cellulosilytica]ADU30079.1 peptidase S11 D-alanyl-D-alanine carboxypeptidase 1 [Evansella cellulosilytica DSM 2522]